MQRIRWPVNLRFYKVAGCSEKNPARGRPRAKNATPQRRGHSAPSDAIAKAIRERFADSKIADEKFGVHVPDGRATLTGNTNVLQHKGVAARLAKAQRATEVVNNIEPSEEARQKAAANLTKGRRRAQIKRADARSRP